MLSWNFLRLRAIARNLCCQNLQVPLHEVLIYGGRSRQKFNHRLNFSVIYRAIYDSLILPLDRNCRTLKTLRNFPLSDEYLQSSFCA